MVSDFESQPQAFMIFIHTLSHRGLTFSSVMLKIPDNMLQASLVVLLIKKLDVETSLEGINLPKTLTQAS